MVMLLIGMLLGMSVNLKLPIQSQLMGWIKLCDECGQCFIGYLKIQELLKYLFPTTIVS